jgi:hypothetical protein
MVPRDPASVQRRPISPGFQFLTLRCVRRTISIVEWHGFVDADCASAGPWS